MNKIKNTKDWSGQKLQKFMVLYRSAFNLKRRCWLYLMKCECGAEKLLDIHPVISGDIISCGCYRKETTRKLNTTHGFGSKNNSINYNFYKTFLHMQDRCYNPKCRDYKNYGKIGIKLCDKWKNNFENFKNDMFFTWKKGLTIERINVSGDYSP
ncbi:MAG: hypothetical protein AABY22_31020, partial [Nanoarchaeota archaeon]